MSNGSEATCNYDREPACRPVGPVNQSTSQAVNQLAGQPVQCVPMKIQQNHIQQRHLPNHFYLVVQTPKRISRANIGKLAAQ